ncbi:MAG: amidohydrolase family protein, partial [Anaerolineaceae bacterium]|nr:amidohydrolase family protein [Anaerolineaceae bacterium]
LPSYAKTESSMYPGMIEDGETSVQNTIAAFDKWEGTGDGRIQVWFGPRTPGGVTPGLYDQISALASERNMGITVHLAEVREDHDYSKSQGCRSPIEFAEKHGLLGSRSVLAHCVWTDEEDWKLIAATSSHVTHNPASNAKTASGIAGVKGMLDVNVNVCLGCDGGPSNNTYDMIRDMRLTSYLANLRENDPTVVPAETVLELATINGAKAMGLGEKIGSIEVGKKADFIIIDMDKPHLTPAGDPVSTIVYAANGSDVDTVVIDGKIIMQGREVLTLDEPAIIEKARHQFSELTKRANVKISPRWPMV